MLFYDSIQATIIRKGEIIFFGGRIFLGVVKCVLSVLRAVESQGRKIFEYKTDKGSIPSVTPRFASNFANR